MSHQPETVPCRYCGKPAIPAFVVIGGGSLKAFRYTCVTPRCQSHNYQPISGTVEQAAAAWNLHHQVFTKAP